MEFSRPRPSILSLFDPLSSTPELDRAASPDSDKENDFIDFFNPSGTQHIYVPPRSLKCRLVDVGDTTVEHPNVNALLSDELEQEISYIVNDDDENDTLTFRDMAKAATPKWSCRNTTAIETPKASPLPRTPLAEISLKDELTPLAPKKHYKRQSAPTTRKGIQSACHILPPLISSDNYSGSSHAEIPQVRVNDELVPQSSSTSANSLSESSSPGTLNHSIPTETLVTGSSSSLVAPVQAQMRTRHLSPMPPTDNVNRYSVDLQSSFQIHFPSHDTTFDLLNDKISFFGSKNELDSSFNILEGDSGLDDDTSIPGTGFNTEDESEVLSKIALNQTHSVVKSAERLIDHPTSLSKDVGVTKPSKTSHAKVDTSTVVQPSRSNQIDNMHPLVRSARAKATFVQPDVFRTPSNSPPLPLVANNPCPNSTSSSFVDNPRHPPQIPALRIIKRSKTITRRNSGINTVDCPPQDVLIPVGSRVPVTEAPALSSLATIAKKGNPSEVQVKRTDKTYLPPSLASNGPRRVLISEGPKLNLAANAKASEQVKPSGPRRVVVAVMERASSPTKPPVQPSRGLRQPVKYGIAVKPVQRTVGSRLPAITRRSGEPGVEHKGIRRVT